MVSETTMFFYSFHFLKKIKNSWFGKYCIACDQLVGYLPPQYKSAGLNFQPALHCDEDDINRGTSVVKNCFTASHDRGMSMCGIGSVSASAKYVSDLNR